MPLRWRVRITHVLYNNVLMIQNKGWWWSKNAKLKINSSPCESGKRLYYPQECESAIEELSGKRAPVKGMSFLQICTILNTVSRSLDQHVNFWEKMKNNMPTNVHSPPFLGLVTASLCGRCFTIKLHRSKLICCIFVYPSFYQSSNLRDWVQRLLDQEEGHSANFFKKF